MTNIAYIPFTDFFDELKKYHKDLVNFLYANLIFNHINSIILLGIILVSKRPIPQ